MSNPKILFRHPKTSQNAFKDQRISGLPWATISVVILVLFAVGGGGSDAVRGGVTASEAKNARSGSDMQPTGRE